MTSAEFVYRRRIVVDHARKDEKRSRDPPGLRISRIRCHEWKVGPAAMGRAPAPKERQPPQMPSPTPTHVVDRL